jgi:hypothetical protein
MGPVVFASLPWVFSFSAAVLLLQWCMILIGTGKRHLSKVAIALVSLAGGAIGEGLAMTCNVPAFTGILAGLAGGAILGRYLRPVGVGMALAYLGFAATSNAGPIQYVQYVAALVMFAYGLLLTDVAPTFVSELLASSIMMLVGEWLGAPVLMAFELVTTFAAFRILIWVVPLRFASRNQLPRPPHGRH